MEYSKTWKILLSLLIRVAALHNQQFRFFFHVMFTIIIDWTSPPRRRSSHLAALSKLNPDAGLSRTFDSAMVDGLRRLRVTARLCAWGRCLERHIFLSFGFGEKMEKHFTDSRVKGVSTGVSKSSRVLPAEEDKPYLTCFYFLSRSDRITRSCAALLL